VQNENLFSHMFSLCSHPQFRRDAPHLIRTIKCVQNGYPLADSIVPPPSLALAAPSQRGADGFGGVPPSDASISAPVVSFRPPNFITTEDGQIIRNPDSICAADSMAIQRSGDTFGGPLSRRMSLSSSVGPPSSLPFASTFPSSIMLLPHEQLQLQQLRRMSNMSTSSHGSSLDISTSSQRGPFHEWGNSSNHLFLPHNSLGARAAQRRLSNFSSSNGSTNLFQPLSNGMGQGGVLIGDASLTGMITNALVGSGDGDLSSRRVSMNLSLRGEDNSTLERLHSEVLNAAVETLQRGDQLVTGSSSGSNALVSASRRPSLVSGSDHFNNDKNFQSHLRRASLSSTFSSMTSNGMPNMGMPGTTLLQQHHEALRRASMTSLQSGVSGSSLPALSNIGGSRAPFLAAASGGTSLSAHSTAAGPSGDPATEESK
jgi:hypothetical protein